MNTFFLKRTDSDLPGFRRLVALLDDELAIRDGAEHAFYAQYNKVDAIKHVIVAYNGDQAIACGAIKPFDEKSVEVKRMFVEPEYRNKGIASQILSELEAWTKELGFSSCVLETGKQQPEAIGLYHKIGYYTIPNYGPYAGIENSVCMQKDL